MLRGLEALPRYHNWTSNALHYQMTTEVRRASSAMHIVLFVCSSRLSRARGGGGEAAQWRIQTGGRLEWTADMGFQVGRWLER